MLLERLFKMTTTSTTEHTQLLSESQAYTNSCSKYEQKAVKVSVNSNTITVAGFGCKVSVSRKALVVKPGSTHSGNDLEPTVLYPGIHTIKSIILLADSVSITLDAVEWCVRQKVCI
jgi:hypothetical protein